MTFAAHSAPPEDPPVAAWYCANCAARLVTSAAALPEICPACACLTTWLDHVPRHARRLENLRGRVLHHERPVAGVRCYSLGPRLAVGEDDDDGRRVR